MHYDTAFMNAVAVLACKQEQQQRICVCKHICTEKKLQVVAWFSCPALTDDSVLESHLRQEETRSNCGTPKDHAIANVISSQHVLQNSKPP